MSGKLLDTNAVIALQKKDLQLMTLLASDEETFIPAPAISELYYGAYNSLKVADNLAVVDEFVMDNTILVCDAVTAKIFGEIKQHLKIKGRPIPINDLWIAALALQHNLKLVTRDAHFKEITTLQIETW